MEYDQRIFTANMKTLQENYDSLYRRINAMLKNIDLADLCAQVGKARDEGLYFTKSWDNRQHYISGRYNPIKDAEIWINHLNELEKNIDTVFIFGIGLGYEIKAFLQNTDKKTIVFEPDMEVLCTAMMFVDLQEVIKSDRVLLVSYDNALDTINYLNSFVVNKNINELYFAILPAYSKKYANMLNDIRFRFKDNLQLIIHSMRTEIFFLSRWVENTVKNISRLQEAGSMTKFENMFNGFPAILVSAGPSLDKNILEIKRIREENKAIIISAGSAAKILNKNGVEPHFMFGIDGGAKETDIFENLFFKDTIMCYANTVHYGIWNAYSGRKLNFMLQFDSFSVGVNTILKHDEQVLSSGGSVSTTAMDFAHYLGCNPIILTGQDLSYPNMQHYAKGAINPRKLEEQNEEQKNLYVVKDVYGNDVHTQKSMELIKIWFENFAEKKSDGTTYINCTEGGLNIKGYENMFLVEAEKQYMHQDNMLIDKINSVYRDSLVHNSSLGTKEFIQTLKSKCDDVIKNSDERLKIASDLIDAIEHKKFSSKTSIKGKEKLTKLTRKLEESEYGRMLISILNTVLHLINVETNSKINELKDNDEKLKTAYKGLTSQYVLIKIVAQQIIKNIDEIDLDKGSEISE